MDITTRAMLANISISVWTAKKHDKKVSAQVAEQHGSRLDMGRYNKALVDNEAIKKITTAVTEARTWNYERTMPWLDNGARILPAVFFDEYRAAMKTFRQAFEARVESFVADYPRLKEDARVALNGLYREDDYPRVDQIRSKFKFEVQIYPIPAASDFRVELDGDLMAQVRRDIERNTTAAIEEAMREPKARVHKAVAHMVDRLGAYRVNEEGHGENVFRDSLVENLRKLAGLLPGLNITSDPMLDSIAADIRDKLCRYDAPTLRESPTIRADVRSEAQAILDRMAGYAS